jgi:hypothetical protein
MDVIRGALRTWPMAYDFDIRHFLRRAPKPWLRRYFDRAGVLSHIDWASIKVRNIDLLIEGLGDIDEDLMGRIVQDFREIELLSTPAGKVQIIDESVFHGKQHEVSVRLTELAGFYECAFWTFFEQPECWRGAVSFADADTKPRRQWRKRINLPALGRSTTAADGKALGAAIVAMFRQKEGRGEYCVVEQYRRGEKEYYFAYPQDHRQVAIEYTKGEMTKRPHRPAFEIIFIHDDSHRTLSIWHQGKRERTVDLQLAFANAILWQEISRESPRDDRVYDFKVFLDPDFVFVPHPELGIKSAEVRQIGMRILGSEQYTISVALGAKTPSHILQGPLRTLAGNVNPSMVRITRVKIRVAFDPGPDARPPKTCQFDLTWPNSCNLPNDSHGLLIQRMLVAHGIEPRPPGDEPDDRPS